MRTILFICTGNTCRSPMAEAIAQDWMDRELPTGDSRVLAVSAGVMAAEGFAPSPEAVRSLDRMGLVVDGRSKPLTAEMIRNARAVFAMTCDHVKAACDLLDDEPEQVGKIRRLDPEGDAQDPIGQGQEAYDRLADRFREIIPKRLREVLLHEDRAGIGSPGS